MSKKKNKKYKFLFKLNYLRRLKRLKRFEIFKYGWKRKKKYGLKKKEKKVEIVKRILRTWKFNNKKAQKKFIHFIKKHYFEPRKKKKEQDKIWKLEDLLAVIEDYKVKIKKLKLKKLKLRRLKLRRLKLKKLKLRRLKLRRLKLKKLKLKK